MILELLTRLLLGPEGDFLMAFVEPGTAIAIGSALGGLGGFFGGGEEEKARQFGLGQMRDALGELSSRRIGETFNDFSGIANPFINQMMTSNNLAAQGAANSAQAGLARAGLGNTGLGSALSAGLQSGAAFEGNSLRAKILSEMFGQAVRHREQRAGTIMSIAGMGGGQQQNRFGSAITGAGIGAQIADGLFPGDGG